MTVNTVITINDASVSLKRLQEDVDKCIEGVYLFNSKTNIATIQGLINRVNQLSNNLDTTKVDFQYNTSQIHEMVCRELDNMSVDKVQPATYIAMIDAFTTIINEL